MLLQQPPSSHIGLIETGDGGENLPYTEAAIGSRKSTVSYIRMKHLDNGVAGHILLASQGKWVLWEGELAAWEPNLVET